MHLSEHNLQPSLVRMPYFFQICDEAKKDKLLSSGYIQIDIYAQYLFIVHDKEMEYDCYFLTSNNAFSWQPSSI